MKKNHGTVSNICYALKLIRTCSPHYLLWDIVYGILLGIWGSAAVVFTQIFYNALFEDGDFPEILRIIGIMLILTVLYRSFGHNGTQACSDRRCAPACSTA